VGERSGFGTGGIVVLRRLVGRDSSLNVTVGR